MMHLRRQREIEDSSTANVEADQQSRMLCDMHSRGADEMVSGRAPISPGLSFLLVSTR